MNPHLLVKRGEDTPVAQFCTGCGTVYALGEGPNGDAAAEQCCRPYKCGDCGEETGRMRLVCDGCQRKKLEAQEAARFAAAERVPFAEATPLLYDPAGMRYVSPDEADDDPPACGYAYLCTSYRLYLNAQEIVDNALESQEHHDDARVPVALILDLQAFLDGWLERTDVETWTPDDSRVVLFNAPEPAVSTPVEARAHE